MAYSFNELCDGCSACVHQCPTSAIYGERKVAYSVEASLCIDCGVCGMICPVDAVLDERGKLAARVPRDQRPRPVVDLDMCNGCGLCLDFCPPACLSLVGAPQAGVAILHEPMACISCGECADICIKGAMKMRPVSLRDLDPDADRQRGERVLEIYLGRPR